MDAAYTEHEQSGKTCSTEQAQFALFYDQDSGHMRLVTQPTARAIVMQDEASLHLPMTWLRELAKPVCWQP